MRKSKTKLYQLYLRCVIAWRIFTGEDKHFVIISLDDRNFTNVIAQSLFTDSNIKEARLSYVGLCEIHAYYALSFALGTFDPDAVPLMRAEFQAMADEAVLYANSGADGKR